jgi:hypothetical protein
LSRLRAVQGMRSRIVAGPPDLGTVYCIVVVWPYYTDADVPFTRRRVRWPEGHHLGPQFTVVNIHQQAAFNQWKRW